MKLRKLLAPAALALTLASAATAGHAATVVNGGFQDAGGSLAGWTVSGNVFAATGATYGPCCSTSGSEPNYSSNYFASFGSANLAGLNTISQSFSTVLGKVYTLSFDYGALGGGSQAILATAGGVSNLFNAVANDNLDATFSNHSFTFVGNGGVQTVSFAINSPAGDNVDGVLDRVSVSAVPEPMTWALMLVGFMGMGAMLRRKKTLATVSAA